MIVDLQIPPELRTLITEELRRGERLVWTGQPIPRRYSRRSLPAFLFGIPWTAFSILWMAGVNGWQWPDFAERRGMFSLFGIPFVLVGLVLLATPLWMRRRARRTAYVITDSRAIIFDGGWRQSTTIRSLEPSRLQDVRRTQHSDGSGDLIFERTWKTDSEGDQQSTDHGFLAISNVKEVGLMVEALAKAELAEK